MSGIDTAKATGDDPEIIVPKSRNGKQGIVTVGFKGEFKRFVSIATKGF